MSLLFVYGTLMQGFHNAFAKKLQENAVWRGKASFLGRLYDLGTYPGAVYDASSDELVQGEVWQMNDPTKTIAMLDDYEEINAKNPEYVRLKISAKLESGEIIDCWAYIYCQSAESLLSISGGDYRKWVF